MRVFVTGATGFIGSAVAGAFARAGHEVRGLCRTPAKARGLAALEVTPVAGTLDDPALLVSEARAAHASVHCAVEYSPRTWDLHGAVLDALLSGARAAGRARTVVATSGVWVYGDTGDGVADETSPERPLPFVAPRSAMDRRVLEAAAGDVRTFVLRPGCVYGGSGSLTAAWFESAVSGGAARVVGDGSARWAMVHRDDLAALYLRAVESGLAGGLFNATDRSRFTTLDCARAASRAAGTGGAVTLVPVAEAAATYGPMAEALATGQHVDSTKAVRLLGWQPRHGGFADGAARYFESWRASTAG